MGPRSLLLAALLPLAAALCAAQAREGLFEARLRVGVLSPGRCECSIMGLGDTVEAAPGFCASLDLLVHPVPPLAIGLGAEVQAPRSLEGFEGGLGFIPLYGTARLSFLPPPASVYLVSRAGWALPYGDGDFSAPFTGLSGGLHCSAGLGAELRLQRLGRRGGALFLEAAYSASSGALTDDWFDLRTDLRVHGLVLAAGLAKGF